MPLLTKLAAEKRNQSMAGVRILKLIQWASASMEMICREMICRENKDQKSHLATWEWAYPQK